MSDVTHREKTSLYGWSFFVRRMENVRMQEKAKQIVVDYFNARVDKKDKQKISIDDVYVVWFCKTLQNWKALLSTTVPDGMYYELTYNGDKHETYVDAYRKWENVVVADE